MGINPINNISIIIRILFAVTLFQHLPAQDQSKALQTLARSHEHKDTKQKAFRKEQVHSNQWTPTPDLPPMFQWWPTNLSTQ
jgi:hypothetical protein